MQNVGVAAVQNMEDFSKIVVQNNADVDTEVLDSDTTTSTHCSQTRPL